jgi:signal transduction histidine kinase
MTSSITCPDTDFHGPASRSRRPIRHSLLLRLTLALTVLVAVMSAGLFFGIDHFISRQFHDLRDDRLSRLATQVRQVVDQDLLQLDSITQLLVNDTELKNNTYYYLYLEGERIHPQAVVERIMRAFHVASVSLWDPQGRLIAASAGVAPAPLRHDNRPNATIRWVDGEPWLVASAPILRSTNLLARLQLARPLRELFQRHGFGAESEYPVAIAHSKTVPEDAFRVRLDTAGEPPVFVDVSIPDTVGKALSEVKSLLSLILAGGAVVIAISFILFLRWQLRPLMALTQAVAAVGRGEFGISLPPSGTREVAGLMSAFNAMTRDLSELKRKEIQWQHQEQLSAIGRVAARVAHDINNPLTVIRNITRLMQRRYGEDEEAAGDLKLVLHHCERCIRIVENLLHYGRPIRLHPENVDLIETCRRILEHWRDRNGIAIDFIPRGEALWIDADVYQLEQMLENLLNNAKQAAPGKPVRVEVGGQDSQVWLRVTDGGPGFSAEAQAHLFEPFFTTKDGGSGLGLASCLAIARAHGGNIEITPGEIGQVTVWLPRRVDQTLRG